MVAITVALVALVTIVAFNLGGDVSDSPDATVNLQETSDGVTVTVLRNENVEEFRVEYEDGTSKTINSSAGSTKEVSSGNGKYTVIAILQDGSEKVLRTTSVTTNSASDGSGSGDAFVIRVDSTNSGDTNSDQFRVSTGSDSFNYNVSWEEINTSGGTTSLTGDMVIDSTSGENTSLTGDKVINFTNPGVHELRITGDIPHIQYGLFNSDSPKIISIEQWGNNEWQSMDSMFLVASNLDGYNATDEPDLSSVTSMDAMFSEASSFDQNISSWCVSQISTKPSDFDLNAGFDGDSSKQPNWGDPCS